MAIRMIESFGWYVAGAQNNIAKRYNSTNTSGDAVAGAGRYGGAAFQTHSNNDCNFDILGLPTGPTIVVGFNFLSDNVGTDGEIFSLFHNPLATFDGWQMMLKVNAAGLLEVWNGNASNLLATGTVVLPVTGYVQIEWEVFFNPVIGSSRVWVENVLDINVSNVNTSPAATPTTASGRFKGLPGGPFSNTQFCDLWMKDTAGNLGGFRRVSLKTPISDGALLQWVPSAAVPHFGLVNEIPPDSDTTFVASQVVGDIDLYGFSALPFNPTIVEALQVSNFARQTDALVNQLAPVVRSAGANFTGAAQTLPAAGTYRDLLTIYGSDPATGAAWKGLAVDAAQFGQKVTAQAAATDKRVSQVMVEVLHSLVPVVPVPVVPAGGGTGAWFKVLEGDIFTDRELVD